MGLALSTKVKLKRARPSMKVLSIQQHTYYTLSRLRMRKRDRNWARNWNCMSWGNLLERALAGPWLGWVLGWAFTGLGFGWTFARVGSWTWGSGSGAGLGSMGGWAGQQGERWAGQQGGSGSGAGLGSRGAATAGLGWQAVGSGAGLGSRGLRRLGCTAKAAAKRVGAGAGQ
ncbi:hypothetical protein Acr_10g0007530 [Actinidia rufa]|uniref:Uncharacterized protein n=1 Tax=Actinidia rufa TaxID=165716 RepID=A0A7J0F9J0_9ERIC|nr:hypothetical protein Acr_10g0007530 [Actinidia rufa]